MILPPFAFLSLAYVVKGITTNATSSSCPPDDGPTRSLWSILWSCALTLLICVWHIAHPGVPVPKYYKWYDFQRYRRMVTLVIWCFSSPEVKFRDKEFAYEWSMAHSHFAQMGGFVYYGSDSDGGLRAIGSLEFLELCEKKEIINANITREDIMDKSKSDLVGKAVYGVQLLWFILQVAVRHFDGLAVTLVELYTVAMAVLSIMILGLWLDKPLRPKRPYVFYSPQQIRVYPQPDLINEWRSFPGGPLPRIMTAFSIGPYPDMITQIMAAFGLERLRLSSRTTQTSQHRSERDVPADPIDDSDVHTARLHFTIALCVTWIILGGIHIMAWNADFPTYGEKILWRFASLVLTGLPFIIVIVWGLLWAIGKLDWCDRDPVAAYIPGLVYRVASSGIIVRVVLAGLMLASLRAVPCSTHQTIPWTDFIPHL